MQKTCIIHGVLSLNDIGINKIKGSTRKKLFCRICTRPKERAKYNTIWEKRWTEDSVIICTKCKIQKTFQEYNPSGLRFKYPLCKNCLRERSRISDIKRAPKNRERGLLRNFGITLTQFNDILIAQNNLCGICKLPETKKGRKGGTQPLSVDHCHSTNAIRGLLCQKCNTGIGMFDDCTDKLNSAINWIKKSSS